MKQIYLFLSVLCKIPPLPVFCNGSNGAIAKQMKSANRQRTLC